MKLDEGDIHSFVERKHRCTSHRGEYNIFPDPLEEQRPLNPWGIMAAKNLSKIKPADYDISKYRKTIKTLESSPSGVSVEDISKMTHKKRETEAAYLNDLYIAGIVEKIREGDKVFFRLIENYERKIEYIFGVQI